tara:strand:- start:236 stop:466 length:231 start_codon:yes stop_codon:yes gene_type:complete
MNSIFSDIQKEMDEFFDHIDSILDRDPDEVDVITDHLPEPKCGMDELVEKVNNSRMGLIEDEADFWEMKAELHFEK